MARYTDFRGKQIILCDHCRQDMPLDSPAFTLSPGKVAESYISRDYDKGEMVLCPTCADTVGQVLTLLGPRRSDRFIPTQEAA